MAADASPHTLLRRLGIRDATAVEPVSGGWDTTMWRVVADDSVYALRVFGQNRMDSRRVELLTMRAAADAGIPVPHIHAHEMTPDSSALLLSWMPGQTMLAEALEHPERAGELGRSLGQMHARIHAVSAPDELTPITGCWIDWIGPDEEDLQARLHALPLRSNALLHFDYHVLNVMADAGGLTAVLDWCNAAAGDPRADVARTHSLLALAPVRPGAPPHVAALRQALLAAWQAGYEEEAGPPEDMALFHAWAGAFALQDLIPKLGRPGIWLQQSDLDRLAQWTAGWKERAGLS